MSPIWYVYLLKCADGSLYCGVTTNLEKRLAQHNGVVPGGARYTRGRRPVVLAKYVTCGSRSEAQAIESRVKATPRIKKLDFLVVGA